MVTCPDKICTISQLTCSDIDICNEDKAKRTVRQCTADRTCIDRRTGTEETLPVCRNNRIYNAYANRCVNAVKSEYLDTSDYFLYY